MARSVNGATSTSAAGRLLPGRPSPTAARAKAWRSARYLAQQRQDDYVENLCRKLLAYALGRSLLVSDDATIKTMRQRLADDGYRFDRLIESIVTSPQFLNKRGKDDPRE